MSPRLRIPNRIPHEILADGPKVVEFEETAAEFLEAKYAIATNSGTMALFLVFRVLEQAGKNIIMPAFTWRSTAEAAIMAGAKPVFADIDRDDLCLDYKKVRELADIEAEIICVNDCFGCPADYKNLNNFGLTVVSDSASAFGAFYNRRVIGARGIHCFSLSPTKNLTANEGGLITCNDESVANKLRVLRRWAGRMTEFNAACALEGLKYLPETLAKKAEIARGYYRFARKIPYWQVQWGIYGAGHVGGRASTWKDTIVVLPSKQERDGLRRHLEAAGIETRVYFTPAQRFLKEGQYYAGDLTVTEDIFLRSLCLPCWVGVDQEYVIQVMQEFCKLSKNPPRRAKKSLQLHG